MKEISELRRRVAELERLDDERKKGKKALADEARYRSVAEGLGDVFWQLDLDFCFTYVSDSVVGLLGYSSEEVVGKPLTSFLSEESTRVMDALRNHFQASAHESPTIMLLHFNGKDGSSITVEVGSSADFDEAGVLVSYRGAARDAGVRAETDKELRWKTALLEAQISSSLDGIVVVDGRGCKLLQNRRAVELWKLPAHIVDNTDDKAEASYVAEMTVDPGSFLDKVRYLYAHPDEMSRDEIELKNGTVLDRYSSPVVGVDGARYGRVWTFRDITDRKRAEEALKRKTSFLEALVHSSHDGILVVSEGRKILQNQRTADLWKIPKEIAGQDDIEKQVACIMDMTKEPTEFREKALAFDLHPKDSWRGEVELVDGTVLDRDSCPIEGTDGEYYGRLWTFRDITDRKRAEEELRTSRLQLEEAAEMARIAYWEYDGATREFIFNNGFYRLYATDARKENGFRMSGDEYRERFVHPDEREELRQHAVKNRTSHRVGNLEQYEHRGLRRDGTVIHILNRTRLFRDPDGHVVKMVGVNQDITARKRMEDALREYEKVIESTPDVIVVVDREYRYRAANSTFLRLRGLRRNQVVGRSVTDVVGSGLFAETFKESLGRCFRGEPVQYETKRTHPGIGERDLLVTYHPVQGPRGIDRVACIIQDITEKKKVDEALKKSERKYRALFDTMRDGFASADLNGRIVEANPACLAMLGYRPDEILDTTYDSLTPERWHAFEEKIIKEQVLVRGYSDVYIKELMRKDGTVFPAEMRTHLLVDEGRNPVGIWSFIRDVTDRKRSDDALKESETKLRAILDASRDAISVSRQGVRVFVNRSSASLFGYESADDLVGVPVRDGIAPESREFPEQMARRHEAGDMDPPVYEITGLKKDGTTFLMEITVSSYVVNGEQFTLTVLRDVTEKKRLEEQLLQAQKMQAVGTLAGGVAHDFNNILTVIMGLGNIMQMSIGKDDINRAYADQIVASSERAADLTRSLLAFSRKQRIVLAPHEVNGVVTSVTKFLTRLLPEDIVLTMNLTDEDTSSLLDVTQIGQVLMNLATNARDAMPGGGTLIISTRRAVIDETFLRTHGFGCVGSYVELSVSDTGIGMDEATAKRIFEPFFTTKEVGKGTGLGLAGAYGIVKQHDGYITVSTSLLKGTTFDVYLPLHNGSSREASPEEDAPRRGTETLLIVEDDRDVRFMLTTILKNQGYVTLEAVNGDDALRIYREHGDQIEVVILDVVMPGKNGKEVLDEISRVNPGVKAIFISGYTGDVIIDKGIRSESVDFLQKPISVQALTAKVREVLDRETRAGQGG